MLKHGMIVEINKFGKGKIIKIVGKNAIVSLKSLNDIQIELPLASMTPLEDTSRDESAVTSPVERTKSPENNTVKKVIEALRFGLVPEENIEELTLGFDELSNWSEKCFQKCMKDVPCGFEISGPYGTGKSHTLSLIRYLAREKGFLTLKVELDGQTVSLSKPAVLLNNLWSSLSENAIDFEEPLIGLYIKAVNNGCIPSKIITDGNDKIKNNLTTIQTLIRTGHLEKYASIVASVISSGNEYSPAQAMRMIKERNINKSDIILERMIGSKVSLRGLDFIEVLAGHAVLAKLAGYKGLIITMDEFEIEYTDRKKILKVEDILSEFHNYFKGITKYFNAPLGIFFAVIDNQSQEGDPLIEKYIAFNKGNRYRLRVFSRHQRLKLAQKIHSMYCKAYSLEEDFTPNLTFEVENLLEMRIDNNDSGLIRSFIKWYLSLLDVKHGPPGNNIVNE